MNFEEAYTDTCSSVGLAARTGDLKSLKNLLQDGASPDVCDNRGWTPLHEAAFSNHHECQTRISNTSIRRFFINKAIFDQETTIDLAPGHGHVENVKILINRVMEHGADLQKKAFDGVPFSANRHGCTALWEADSSKKVECMKLLLEAELHPESETESDRVINRQTYDGQTPLHLAVESQLCEVVKLLLDYGVRLDVFDDNHRSPIFVAAHRGCFCCLEKLIEAAKSRGQDSLINAPACDKATPLHIAARRGIVEFVRLLLKSGADPNLKAEGFASLPVHKAIYSAGTTRYECLVILLLDTSPGEIDKCYNSLVDHVLISGDLLGLAILLEHAIYLNEEVLKTPCNNIECNPYNIIPAVNLAPFSYKYLSLVGLSVSFERVNFDLIPIRCCELTRGMLAEGFSPDARVEQELPPILAAVYVNRIQFLEVLLEYGADVHVKHPDFLGDITVTCAAGLKPPSSCLLLLFLHGASPDSCFGRASRGGNSEPNTIPDHKWSIQDLLLKYHSANAWMHAARLTNLMCLCWNPQLDPRLQNVIYNTGRWEKLKELADDCSTLKHLCRRQIFKNLAQKNAYRPEILKSYQLPVTLMDYLFSSTVGLCYRSLAKSLQEDLANKGFSCSSDELSESP